MNTERTGAKVQMTCYRDAQRPNLNYSSRRWFDVLVDNGDQGWVRASQVEAPVTVGYC